MKKIITIAVLLINSIVFSQIKVIETIPIEKLGRVSNSVYIQKEANEYTVFYKNAENSETTAGYRKFSFKDLDNDYESLFNIIMGGFAASPLYDVKLELPNDFVWLHYIKSSDNNITVQFLTSNKMSSIAGISETLTKAQIAKLFEKDRG